jgi:hypothetical protein
MPYRRYLRAVNDKFGFLGTWLPNQKIALGDIGTLEKGVFRRHESLAALGYKLEEDSSDFPVDFDHSSASRIVFSAGGQVHGIVSGLGDGETASTRIEFSESGGFVLRATGCVDHGLASRAALQRAVFDARAKGIWRDDWVVIDRLYMADGLTIVVCNSSSGSLTLSASGSAGAGPFDIARADLGVSVSAWAGDITKVVAAGGLTPMFSAIRLRTGFFSGDRIDTASLPRLKDVRTAGGPDPRDMVPVSIQDALDEE